MTRSRLVVLALVLVGVSAAPAAARAGDYIVVLKDGVSVDSAVSKHKSKHGADVFHVYKHALRGYAAKLSRAGLAAVRADSQVQFVAEDSEYALGTSSPAPLCDDIPERQTQQCLPEGVDRIDGELSSTQSGDGVGTVTGVNVAVIDTGIEVDHPELNVVGGVNCRQKKPSTKRPFDDELGHGSAVAGLIGARDNGFGVVGVAPGVRLWAANIARNDGLTNGAGIICAVDWVTSTRQDSDPTNDIAVANASFSSDPNEENADDGNCGRTKSDPLHLAICASVNAGVTYVVAAGNEGVDLALENPASYDEVLTATAMSDFDEKPGALDPPDCNGEDFGQMFGDFDDAPASFSNYATVAADINHTLSAPGVCLFTTLHQEPCAGLPAGENCYALVDGTSFSSPIIAGTAALCISRGQCTGTPAQIIQKLRTDAAAYNQANPGYGFVGDPLRPIPGKYYGWLIRAGLY